MGVGAGWKAFDDAVVRASIVGEFANTKAGVDANIWIHQGWAMRKTGSVQAARKLQSCPAFVGRRLENHV